jgi:integrase
MGSISAYETAAGKRYRVRYRKPDHSSTDKRGFRTRREAELFLANIEVSKARGEYVDPTGARVTVGTLGSAWLASQTHLKPSALEPIEISWRLFVEPVWGSRGVSTIRHTEVQAWVSSMTAGTAVTGHSKPPGPRSASVVLRAYGILAGILDGALKDRRLSANPARGVTLPRKGKKPRVYLSHEQVEILARSAGQYGTLVRLLAYSGARWGEATALCVLNVDFLKRRARIESNIVRVNGGYALGTPKSHEARSIPFPPFLADELAILCTGKSSTSFVFGDGTTHLRTPATRDGWFTRAVERARALDLGMPRVTLHDLRHTAASLAISSGANVKAVQRMLGHASAAMTLDTYADLFDEDLDGVADRLDTARNRAIVGKVWAVGGQDLADVTQFPRVYGDS